MLMTRCDYGYFSDRTGASEQVSIRHGHRRGDNITEYLLKVTSDVQPVKGWLRPGRLAGYVIARYNRVRTFADPLLSEGHTAPRRSPSAGTPEQE